jgi:SAM-dependent methyltransferase
MTVPYDPTIYKGSAPHYVHGRPHYSPSLAATLASELALDGSGRLLDVGCGPGIVAIELAHRFQEVTGLDPDAEMLAEAARQADERGVANVRWVRGLAEDLPNYRLGTFKLVTFGQSLHWTDRAQVAEAVYDMLEPGGALAVIGHVHEGRPHPAGPGYPPIPHEAIRRIIDSYLGPRRRAGQGFASDPAGRHEEVLAKTRFTPPRKIVCPGRPDIVQDVDGVLANYLSMSFAAPHLFGDRLEEFKLELRAELARLSPAGRFWDWPGDTEILLTRKPTG